VVGMDEIFKSWTVSLVFHSNGGDPSVFGHTRRAGLLGIF